MYEIDIEDGLNLIDILKIMFGINKRRKIQFWITVAAVGLIAFLCIFVLYNRTSSYYEASFDYQIPSFIEKVNSETGEIIGYSYLDGTPFNYNSLVTIENLNTAKDSDEKFADLDIEAMYDEGAVLASYSSADAYPYSISIRKKYFKSYADAKEFITALVQLPITISKNLVNSTDNKSYLDAYKDAKSYDAKVDNLTSQANYLINTYKSLVKESPDVYVTYEGKLVKFNELMNITQAKIDSLNLYLLSSQLESGHYVMNYEEELPGLQIKLASLQAASSKYDTYITTYKNSLTAGTVLTDEETEQYVDYVEKKAQTDYQIPVIQGYIADGNMDSDSYVPDTEEKIKEKEEYIEAKQDFVSSMLNAYNVLTQLSDILTRVQKSVYSGDATTVYYSTNRVISVTGDISVLISVVISAVAGIVVAAVINLILDTKKYKTMLDEKRMAKIAAKTEKTVSAEE